MKEFKYKKVLDLEEKDRESYQKRIMTTYFRGVFNQLQIIHKFELSLSENHFIELKPSQLSKSQLPVGSSALLKLLIETVKTCKESLLFQLIAIPHLEENEIKEAKEKFPDNKNAYLQLFCSASIDYFGYMYFHNK